MRSLVAFALVALGCGSPTSSPVVTHADAATDAVDAARFDVASDSGAIESCDAGPAGPERGMLCRGDAASPGSPGFPVAEGLCVNVGSPSNCGACGNRCEGGRDCFDNPQGSGRGWYCRFPMGR